MKMKNIVIKIERNESLSYDEFATARSSGYRAVKISNEYFIVDWTEYEVKLVDGEVINTYGGNYTYHDINAYYDSEVGYYTLFETQYGYDAEEGDLEIESTSDIETHWFK